MPPVLVFVHLSSQVGDRDWLLLAVGEAPAVDLLAVACEARHPRCHGLTYRCVSRFRLNVSPAAPEAFQ